MKILTKILIIVAVIVSIGILIIADISDRNIYYSIHTPKEEFETFQFKPIDEKIKAYKENLAFTGFMHIGIVEIDDAFSLEKHKPNLFYVPNKHAITLIKYGFKK